ncbi:MAG: type II toxin-antitoxin system RelB/DinJ family antitoxin [Candidatus Cryptobacteroides sp.]
MAQTSMTLRVDNSLKRNFDTLCEEFGFTTTAAITVFMKTVVRERRIPFEIKAAGKDEINVKGWEAILQMGREAESAGIQDMSLEEINAIIKEVRDAR